MRETLIVIRSEREGSAGVVRGTLSVILNECEGSITVVKKPVRRHQSHRFFTPCHISAFLLSYKVFLSPFRMTIEGESVMMRGTIRRHNEGNVNRHPERM